MRSAILLLAAVALVAVQAAPVSNGPEAVATPNSPVKCFKDSDGKYECYGLGSVQPKAESAVPAFIPKCTKQKDGTLYCYGLNSVQPKASSIEPEASNKFPARRCELVDGTWRCWVGIPTPIPEAQAPVDPKAASVDAPPIRCGWAGREWQCWGGNDLRSEPQAAADPLGLRTCTKSNGEWVCTGGDGPDPTSEPQATSA